MRLPTARASRAGYLYRHGAQIKVEQPRDIHLLPNVMTQHDLVSTAVEMHMREVKSTGGWGPGGESVRAVPHPNATSASDAVSAAINGSEARQQHDVHQLSQHQTTGKGAGQNGGEDVTASPAAFPTPSRISSAVCTSNRQLVRAICRTPAAGSLNSLGSCRRRSHKKLDRPSD